MISLIITLVLIILGGVLLRAFARSLKDSGQGALADTIEKISVSALREGNRFIEQNKEAICRLASSLVKDIPPEFVEILYKDSVQKLFEKVLPPDITDSLIAATFGTKAGAYVITDDQDHPFQVTDAIVALALMLTSGQSKEYDKAFFLYEWIEKNIAYGDKKLKPKVGYRTAPEVLETEEGVCGEMAVLFIVMARCVSLKSNLAVVSVDHRGKKVDHACASVRTNGVIRLADPAYHRFDVKHKKYRILPDNDAVSMLKTMRRNP